MECTNSQPYIKTIFAIVLADETEFGKKLLPALEREINRFSTSDEHGTQMMKIIGMPLYFNYYISYHLHQYCLEYLKSQNTLFPYLLRLFKRSINELFVNHNSDDFKRILTAYTSDELLKRLQLLDDKAIRRILSDRTIMDFGTAYDGVLKNDLRLFACAIEKTNARELSASWFKEFLMSDCFERTCAMVLENKTNQELFYESLDTRVPDVASIIERCRCMAPAGQTFLDLFYLEGPLVIKRIKQNLDNYLTIPESSMSSKSYLNSLLNHYKFIFEECNKIFKHCNSSIIYKSSDNHEIIISTVCRLVDLALDYYKAQNNKNTNSQIHKCQNDGNDVKRVNQEPEADGANIQKFILSSFTFGNEDAKRDFINSYLEKICSYISSICSIKDFQALCYLIYPFDCKQKNKEDMIKKHLDGNVSWKEEPKDKIECARKLYEVCPISVKGKIKDAFKDYEKYSQSKLRKAILEKAKKQEYQWMIRFIEAYWPISNGEYGKDIRRDMLRDYKSSIKGS